MSEELRVTSLIAALKAAKDKNERSTLIDGLECGLREHPEVVTTDIARAMANIAIDSDYDDHGAVRDKAFKIIGRIVKRHPKLKDSIENVIGGDLERNASKVDLYGLCDAVKDCPDLSELALKITRQRVSDGDQHHMIERLLEQIAKSRPDLRTAAQQNNHKTLGSAVTACSKPAYNEKNFLVSSRNETRDYDKHIEYVTIDAHNKSSTMAIDQVSLSYSRIKNGTIEFKGKTNISNILPGEKRNLLMESLFKEHFFSRVSIEVTDITVKPSGGTEFKASLNSSPCFVTTAAYGDAHHPMVESFRSLRDDVMANLWAGQKFIDWYEKNGPGLASKLEHRPLLRAAARMILTPLAKVVNATRAATKQFASSKKNLRSQKL